MKFAMKFVSEFRPVLNDSVAYLLFFYEGGKWIVVDARTFQVPHKKKKKIQVAGCPSASFGS